jgi:thiamine pyrophosphokinase
MILKNYDFIACADGGANIAFNFKIEPSLIIGDLDSIKPKVRKFFAKKGIPIIYDPDQNSTDIEKALKFLINQGFKQIDITSAIGDRLDHNLGNLSALVNFHGKAKLRIIDKSMEIFFVTDEISFEANPGDRISILPLGENAEGVSTRGLKFKLDDDVLSFSGRGISNIASGRRVLIKVRKGGLFVFRKTK